MAIKENERTAEKACAEHLADIAALLSQIGQELDTRFKPIEESGADWSDAAELSRVKDHMIETMQNLAGFTREEIENTLEELRG